MPLYLTSLNWLFPSWGGFAPTPFISFVVYRPNWLKIVVFCKNGSFPQDLKVRFEQSTLKKRQKKIILISKHSRGHKTKIYRSQRKICRLGYPRSYTTFIHILNSLGSYTITLMTKLHISVLLFTKQSQKTLFMRNK